MPKLPTDAHSRFPILCFLHGSEITAGETPSRWCCPAGEFLIALLDIRIPQAVQVVQSSVGRAALVDLEVLDYRSGLQE